MAQENTRVPRMINLSKKVSDSMHITSHGFVPVDKPILTASYEVAYLIRKHGKPHTICEILAKPAALRMANIMLGTAAKDKLSLVPLSNDIVKNRIDDISEDILHQVVKQI